MELNKEIKTIGGFRPESPFFLAPMAGFTDKAYRTICGEMGAALVYTEMVSAKGLYYGDRKSRQLLEIGPNEKPVGFQIFGREPDIMAWAVEQLENEQNVLIDVNMGCPVPKVVKNGEGSALLREPELIYRIIKKMSDATEKPITVKMRIGIEGMPDGGFLEAAKAIEEGGARAIAVHGRTREQYYSGTADLSAIKMVKDNVSIPVIGNGDIATLYDAINMMEFTGCDFVMIGRAAVGDPWIFRRMLAAWNSAANETAGKDASKSERCNPSEIQPPSLDERIEMMIRHYRDLETNKGEYIAVREMRKFISKYLKGVQGSAAIRNQINTTETGDELCRVLGDVISH